MPLETEPTVEALKEVPVAAVTPMGEEVPVTEVVEAPPVQKAEAVADPPALPDTASQLPLVGLIGLLSVSAGVGLSLIPKRAA